MQELSFPRAETGLPGPPVLTQGTHTRRDHGPPNSPLGISGQWVVVLGSSPRPRAKLLHVFGLPIQPGATPTPRAGSVPGVTQDPVS